MLTCRSFLDLQYVTLSTRQCAVDNDNTNNIAHPYDHKLHFFVMGQRKGF